MTNNFSFCLTYNIKLDGIPTKIRWKMHGCFTLCIKFWEDIFVKSYVTSSFNFCGFTSVFIQHIFHNFLELHLTSEEKHLPQIFPLFHLLNGQNMLSVSKVFCSYYLITNLHLGVLTWEILKTTALNKGSLTQNDLYDMICMTLIQF